MISTIIGIIIIFAACILLGMRRGLFKSLFGLVSIVLAIILTAWLSPYVTDAIIDKTKIDDKIEESIYKSINDKTQARFEELLKGTASDKEVKKMAEEKAKEFMEEEPDKATQMQLIHELDMPGTVKDELIENNTQDIYKELGVSKFYHYVSRKLAYTAVSIVAVILTYIVVRIALTLICLIFNAVITRIPIVAGVNRIGGMLLGAAEGFVATWLFLLILSIILKNDYTEIIKSSDILSWFHDTNIFFKILGM